MDTTLEHIARLIEGHIEGNPETVITGIAGIEHAGPGDITFAANPKYAGYIETTAASAVVCSGDFASEKTNLLKVDDPYLAYAKILRYFYPPPSQPGTIDPGAWIGENVTIGKEVTVYPFVYIGEGSVIEDRATLYPHCFIGKGVSIGEDSLLYPNVTVREGCIIGRRVIIHSGTVIGSDGFGFAKDGAGYYKIPQLGIVQIDDDVEIGAGNTIDRAAMNRTHIKRGTKTDNLVHIAHNVTVGEDSVLVAQVGISGSTVIGDRVTMAGQSATVGHISIGDDVIIGARGAASSDIPSGQIVSGAPHMPHKQWLKSTRVFQKLPEMRKTINELSRKITQLESEVNALRGDKQ